MYVQIPFPFKEKNNVMKTFSKLQSFHIQMELQSITHTPEPKNEDMHVANSTDEKQADGAMRIFRISSLFSVGFNLMRCLGAPATSSLNKTVPTSLGKLFPASKARGGVAIVARYV